MEPGPDTAHLQSGLGRLHLERAAPDHEWADSGLSGDLQEGQAAFEDVPEAPNRMYRAVYTR